jgi:hypothetical protein
MVIFSSMAFSGAVLDKQGSDTNSTVGVRLSY